MKTHTLKTLLALPKEELRVMVAECAGAKWQWRVNGVNEANTAFLWILELAFLPEGWNEDYWKGRAGEIRLATDKDVQTAKSNGKFEVRVNQYPDSLDAMKPLEDGLTDQLEKVNYINKLRQVIGTDKLKNSADCPIVSDFDLISATAHHRAVAYVAVKLKL